MSYCDYEAKTENIEPQTKGIIVDIIVCVLSVWNNPNILNVS